VLGERPMSQRRPALNLIEKQAGLEGLVLRPLSAKLLEPTIPEKEGWVDREKLLDINGRSRKPQIALAAKYGITEYPAPAGGCLLTDPGFAIRLRDLMENNPGFHSNDVQLLKIGRHFRLPNKDRAIIGRDDVENGELVALAQPRDILLDAVDFAGPTSLYRGCGDEEAIKLAAALTAKYGKGREEPAVLVNGRRAENLGETACSFTVAPAGDDVIVKYRVGVL
jgi:tRNA-uridine 2-sulfurtransferase